MDIQKLFDTISKQDELTRSKYHLTLGKAIEILKTIDPSFTIMSDFNGQGPCSPHSYRGYYSDLSIDIQDDIALVGDFLKELEKSYGKTFTGYKGGDFLMTKDTPLWCAPYGNTGRAIMGITIIHNEAIIQTKEID
jgi:hypothetical protein